MLIVFGRNQVASLTGRRGPLACRIFSRLGFELMHLRLSGLRTDTLPRISPFSLNLPRQTPSVTATNTLMVNSERAMSFVSQFRGNGPVRGSSAGPTNRSGQNCVRLKWVTSRSNHGRYLDFKSMPAVTGSARQPPQRRFPKACDSADEPSRNERSTRHRRPWAVVVMGCDGGVPASVCYCCY